MVGGSYFGGVMFAGLMVTTAAPAPQAPYTLGTGGARMPLRHSEPVPQTVRLQAYGAYPMRLRGGEVSVDVGISIGTEAIVTKAHLALTCGEVIAFGQMWLEDEEALALVALMLEDG
jgi:hypothetical protein